MSNPSPSTTFDPKVVLRKDILRLYVFNVGQGDHILLKLPDNTYGIVDFFYPGGLAKCPAVYYLTNLKRLLPKEDIQIAFVCLSHPDGDHLEGLAGFVKWLEQNEKKIGNLWLFGGAKRPLDFIYKNQRTFRLNLSKN